MKTIKSICIVCLTDLGWAVRVRFIDKSCRFIVAGGFGKAKYTLAQIQAAADSLRRDIANHGEQMAVLSTVELIRA